MVVCKLCPHGCSLKERKWGLCGVREAVGGTLVTHVYGAVCSSAVDPIEKKPLFHFLPGSWAFSYATPGCNLACRFCQNWTISQVERGQRNAGTRLSVLQLASATKVQPERLVEEAVAQGCEVVAHTYTEPTVFYEYAYDVARLANERGLKNVFVTNGFINEEPLVRAAKYIQGANIDLKSFSDSTYRTWCRGRLQPVLDTIVAMHRLGIWVEVTTLVVPGVNDSLSELNEIARFLASVSVSIPWHVSRFYPQYQVTDRGPTPEASIRDALRVGREAGLEYVYAGNIRIEGAEDTRCPRCNTTLVKRRGYFIDYNRVSDGRCPDCGFPIAGVWSTK